MTPYLISTLILMWSNRALKIGPGGVLSCVTHGSEADGSPRGANKNQAGRTRPRRRKKNSKESVKPKLTEVLRRENLSLTSISLDVLSCGTCSDRRKRRPNMGHTCEIQGEVGMG